MRSLGQLLEQAGIQPQVVQGSLEGVWVKGLCADSRQVQAGDLFLGMLGSRVDGGEFVREALTRGAVAALLSQEAWKKVSGEAEWGSQPLLVLPRVGLNKAVAQVAAAFYGFPARQLTLVGVTGTNGKTTTTHLIEHLLQAAGRPVALLGTLYNRWPGHYEVTPHTTLFPLELQRSLRQAKEAGAEVAVMEVSSHALAQDRAWGCAFAAAVWTNLTQDHLDFHGSMENYWQAKATLFRPEYLQGRAVVNADDAGGRRLLEAIPAPLEPWAYSLKPLEGIPGLWPSRRSPTSHRPQGNPAHPYGQLCCGGAPGGILQPFQLAGGGRGSAALGDPP
jgi:UDP-N-acetylmuramoyl-L-alanyl-D-glutamate--2,6-diaminopimelate ligase